MQRIVTHEPLDRGSKYIVGRKRAAEGLNVGADLGLGGAEEFVGSEAGDDAAGIEQDDALGEKEGLIEVVGDEEHGLAEAMEK